MSDRQTRLEAWRKAHPGVTRVHLIGPSAAELHYADGSVVVASRGTAGEIFIDRRARGATTVRFAPVQPAGTLGRLGSSSETTARRPGVLVSPTDGTLRSCSVLVGQRVGAGDPIAVIELMKMEMQIRADVAGVVEAAPGEPGTTVKRGEVLSRIRPD